MPFDMERIAIIGAGNLGVAIARGMVSKGIKEARDITLTRRNPATLEEFSVEGYAVNTNNAEAVRSANLVILCVQPKQLPGVLEEISGSLHEDHVLVSVITGVSREEIKNHLSANCSVIRAMPNTAIAIAESMTCISSNDVNPQVLEQVGRIFKSLGDVQIIDENMMKAATVLGASGIAFFMRYLRAATQGGIQMGFHPEEAQKIAVQTAKGAAGLIIENANHPEVEIDKVTTPQGCTIAGLNEMEHQGFSSSLIKGLMTSYEKINSIK